MLEFLWEMHQHRRMVDAESAANRAAGDAREARHTARDHQSRLDTLSLAVMAMWSIMQDRLGVTEEQLVKRMQQLDLQDGKLDGKVAPSMATTCSSCRRMMSTRHKQCMYCGGRSVEVRPFAGL